MKIKRILMAFVFVLMCLSISVAAQRTFVWDKNTESDLKHYTIYRSSAPDVQAITGNLYLRVYKPGENPDINDPYNVEYNNVGNTCELPRNILPDGTYYFVLTASDVAGNESGKSNEVSTIVDDTAPAPPGGFQCN